MLWEGNDQNPMVGLTMDPLRRWLMEKYAPEMRKGNWPHGGLVFDEWSTIVQRAYKDVLADNITSSKNGKEMYDYSVVSPRIRNFHTEVAEVATYTKKPLFLILHEVEPRYHGPEHPRLAGKLETPGGPNFPIRKVITDMESAASFILRIRAEPKKESGGWGEATNDVKMADDEEPWSTSSVIESNLNRFFVTEPTQDWAGGFRDFRVKPNEKLNLRELLTRVGFLNNTTGAHL